jgi:CRP-like cAMP-binding protein
VSQPSPPTARASAFIPPTRPAGPPRAATPKPPVASIADELDFGDLLADDAPAAPRPRAPLPTIPLFSSLSEPELRQLIEGVTVRSLAPGEQLLREGEPGTSLFVIASGEVEVYLEGPPRRSLARLGEGAFVGEQGLLTDSTRSASVAATTPVDVLEITRELIAKVIAESPDVLKVLLRFFRDRMIDRLLRSSALFSHFSDEDARQLVSRLKFLELEPGLPVVAEGKPAPGLFILLCGHVDVTRVGAPLARLGPGDAFGEMSLLRPTAANATVTTATKCWALQLARADFTEIAVTYPQVLEFVSELADRRAAPTDL